MITETAKVIAVDGDMVTVEATVKSTCSSCQAQDNCGTGAISRAMAPKSQQLVLRTPMPVQVGQNVSIGVPEAGILSASVSLYLLPLFTFIITILLGNVLLPRVGLNHELWNLPPALLFTFAAYKIVSLQLKRLDSVKFQPVLLSTTR